MEATLKFNLPKEEQDFKFAQDGFQWYKVVKDIDDELHKIIKYGHNFKKVDDALQFIRKKLREIVNDRYLYLD